MIHARELRDEGCNRQSRPNKSRRDVNLVGKRVLIVEDEFAVALMIGDFLVEFGCTPLGPCSSLASALDAVRNESFDVALLDINLNGERVYPVAHALAERRIPFMFVSGYGEDAIPPEHSDWRVCSKPFRGDELEALLSAALGEALTT
jgi:DNA-binding response OmpR family regulator